MPRVQHSQTHKAAVCLQVPSAARVTGLCLNRKGNLLLVNCHDRAARLYELGARQAVVAGSGGDVNDAGLVAVAGAAAGLPDLEAVRSRLQGLNFKVCASGVEQATLTRHGALLGSTL